MFLFWLRRIKICLSKTLVEDGIFGVGMGLVGF